VGRNATDAKASTPAKARYFFIAKLLFR